MMRREAAVMAPMPELPADDAASDRFQQAVRLAQSLVSPSHWLTLPPADRTGLIYRQLRRLDALSREPSKPKAAAGRARLNG
jgi:hypothetical protein